MSNSIMEDEKSVSYAQEQSGIHYNEKTLQVELPSILKYALGGKVRKEI